MKRFTIFLSVFIFMSEISFSTTPKLVVVISYDQMRGDYPERWGKLWGEKGFNRLKKEGRNFTNCYYNHANNMTCPGHSIIMTGCYPAKTGIVSNDFYDRNLQKHCYCVQNPENADGVKAEDGRSADLMRRGTVGDFLLDYSPKSKVMSIGLKDRAGILMAGHLAKTVLWYDESVNAFTTMKPYIYPVWLTEWNKKNPTSAYGNKIWNAIIPDSIGAKDNSKWEGNFSGGDKIFPHVVPALNDSNFTEAFLESPFSMEYLFNAARVMITKEKLGKDSNPDLFHIAVSSTDYCGHVFGPDSREIEEMYIHVDRVLGDFIDFLDKSVGRKNYLMVITSDHGVGPIPELLNEQGRVQIDAGRLKKSVVVELMNEYLLKTFLPQTAKEQLIERVEIPSVFINDEVVAKYGLNKETVVDSLVEFIKRMEGMKYVASRDFAMRYKPLDWDEETWKLVKNDLYFDRTGEVIMYPKPYWIYGGNPATHGTMYNYDRFVPLMMFGGDINPGVSNEKVSPADIAPTLGFKFRIPFPNIDGKSLDVWKHEE